MTGIYLVYLQLEQAATDPCIVWHRIFSFPNQDWDKGLIIKTLIGKGSIIDNKQ